MTIDKDAAVAAIQAALDAVNALPDLSGSSAEIDALKAQVVDLQGKLDSATSDLAAGAEKIAKITADIETLKADLG